VRKKERGVGGCPGRVGCAAGDEWGTAGRVEGVGVWGVRGIKEGEKVGGGWR